MNELEKRISKVMSNVMEIPVESIDANSNQDNIEGWDSLKHLDLILGLEEEFGLTIPIEEVGSLTTFALIRLIIQEQIDIVH